MGTIINKKYIYLILIYILLLLDSGFYFSSQGGIFLLTQLVISIILMILSKAYIQQKALVILLILCMLVFFNSIFSDDTIRDVAVSIIELISSYFIACTISGQSSDKICKVIRLLIIILCIFSLITFSITFVKPAFISNLPVLVAGNGLRCYFWGLSFSYVPEGFYIVRNPGLFWEPGAYQVYLILALIYELFVYKGKYAKYIYTLTLITTLSSTGFACMMMTWLLYSFSMNKKRSFNMLLLLIFLFLLIYINIDYLPDSIKFNYISKIQSAFSGNSENYITVATRVDSFFYGLDLILSNPLLGIGRGLDELRQLTGNNILSCTPINWMLQYGILFGCLSFIGVFILMMRLKIRMFIKISLFFTILLSISTEAFNLSPTFFTIVFLGFSRIYYRDVNE